MTLGDGDAKQDWSPIPLVYEVLEYGERRTFEVSVLTEVTPDGHAGVVIFSFDVGTEERGSAVRNGLLAFAHQLKSALAMESGAEQDPQHSRDS